MFFKQQGMPLLGAFHINYVKTSISSNIFQSSYLILEEVEGDSSKSPGGVYSGFLRSFSLKIKDGGFFTRSEVNDTLVVVGGSEDRSNFQCDQILQKPPIIQFTLVGICNPVRSCL